MKNEQKTILIIMSVVVVIMLGKQAGLFATFGLLDDYAIYDDFSEVEEVFTIDNLHESPSPGPGYQGYRVFEFPPCTEVWSQYSYGYMEYRKCISEKWITEVRVGGNIDLDIESEKLIIRSGGITGAGRPDGYATLTSTKDFLGYDLKISLSHTASMVDYNYAYQLLHILINNETVWTTNLYGVSGKHLIEIKSSRLDPSNAVLLMNGEVVKELTDLDTLYIGLHSPAKQFTAGEIYVHYVKYRIPFSCKIADDEHLVSENYPAGSVVQLTPDFRITDNGCQVEKFCLAHPAIIESTTAQGTGADYNWEIYEELVRGNQLTVPSDQSYEIFFIAKEASTGFCTEYAGRAGPFHMEVNTTSTIEQYIKPGETARWETNPIPIAELPFTTKATFTIMAEKDGVEQTKEDIIVFRK